MKPSKKYDKEYRKKMWGIYINYSGWMRGTFEKNVPLIDKVIKRAKGYQSIFE